MEDVDGTLDGKRVSTGVAGLDEVLCGGFLPGRAYLVRGGPGAGKTTLGLHFLAAGGANDEPVLFLNQGEDQRTIQHDATAMGIDLSAVSFLDMGPEAKVFSEGGGYDVFPLADVERESFTQQVVEEVSTVKPARVFLDAMTRLRHLSTDVVEFRREAHAFLRFLVEQGATVLFASGAMGEEEDQDLQFMSAGVLNFEYSAGTGRAVNVSKFRGSTYRPGRHSLKVTSRGLEVYPRLVPEDFSQPFAADRLSSGIPELDELLGGGLERGTVTYFSGPTGAGKTTMGMQFVKEAAGRGERSVVYTFEEAADTLIRRSAGVNIPVAAMTERGTLSVVAVEPLRYTPDELASLVRAEVERREAKVVMIDSVSGYRLSLQGEDLAPNLHALCQYLRNMGVTVIVVHQVAAVLGDFYATDSGMSYLADNIVFLRYLELDGELRRLVGVLKKRMSDFEKTLREVAITRYGVRVGPPLTGLRGVLAGVPERVAESPAGGPAA